MLIELTETIMDINGSPTKERKFLLNPKDISLIRESKCYNYYTIYLCNTNIELGSYQHMLLTNYLRENELIKGLS